MSGEPSKELANCSEFHENNSCIKIKTCLYGTFKKNILNPGEKFTKPRLECACIIDLNIDAIEPKGFKDSVIDYGAFKSQDSMELTLGRSESELLIRVEVCLMTMSRNEKSKFIFYLPDSENINEVDPKIRSGNTEIQNQTRITLTITLHKFYDAQPFWKLSSEEKYDLSLSHKNRGTELFQMGNFVTAFTCYSRATRYLIMIPELSVVTEGESLISENIKKYKALKCVCNLNLAACQAKVSNHKSVIKNCTEALSIDGNSVKALYRRAVACIASGQLDLARNDLRRAKKLEPKNKAILSLLQSCGSTV